MVFSDTGEIIFIYWEEYILTYVPLLISTIVLCTGPVSYTDERAYIYLSFLNKQNYHC